MINAFLFMRGRTKKMLLNVFGWFVYQNEYEKRLFFDWPGFLNQTFFYSSFDLSDQHVKTIRHVWWLTIIYITAYVTLNYSWLHISLLKGWLDEKKAWAWFNFWWKTNLACESGKVPKTIVPSNLCILSQIRHFIVKTKLDTRPRSLQEPKMGKWWQE